MIEQIIVEKEQNKGLGLFIGLPGRGQDGQQIIDSYKYLRNFVMVSITPKEKIWYPRPLGPNNQDQAVKGVELAKLEIIDKIEELIKKYEVSWDKTAVVGFSAGGVMALQIGLHCSEMLAVAAHSGAILDVNAVPDSSNKTPYFLCHSKNDDVFGFEERFLPYKTSLQKKNHRIQCLVSSNGGHSLLRRDVEQISNFVEKMISWKTRK